MATLALIYAWFWVVVSHRIGGTPYSGFASVFVTGCGDFEHFYHGARALRDGTDLYASGVRGYIYPPLLAFLFMPLAGFSVQTAAWIMLVVNLGLGLMCAWVMAGETLRRFDVEPTTARVAAVAALATLFAATKLRSEFQMWQTNILLMAALVLALRFLDKRPRLAGLLLGLAFDIKYLPIVFLPYLLLRRRFVAAGWFCVGIVAFALLPALVTGWSTNLYYWAQALSGIAHLFGISTPGIPPANIDPIGVGHSISITSGVSRLLSHAPRALGPAVVACIAAATALVLWRIYRRKGMPLAAWPGAAEQASQPWRLLVVLEWSALIALDLAFSPQTNPRHASLLLMTFVPMAAMLCFPSAGAPRWPAFAATGILLFGMLYPPNLSSTVQELAWWRHIGGAGWCMVLALPFFFVAGLARLRPQRAASSEVADVATGTPLPQSS
ncbi:MAG TPA: glycosyltransferase family 87 protein [Burkholderiaceae bacterium]|nr:glycosyltransferase family 87 protein [Burkholderiaceae bacterium]